MLKDIIAFCFLPVNFLFRHPLLLPFQRDFPDDFGYIPFHFFLPEAEAEDYVKKQYHGNVKKDVDAGGGKTEAGNQLVNFFHEDDGQSGQKKKSLPEEKFRPAYFVLFSLPKKPGDEKNYYS
jgi:hypothetical protein